MQLQCRLDRLTVGFDQIYRVFQLVELFTLLHVKKIGISTPCPSIRLALPMIIMCSAESHLGALPLTTSLVAIIVLGVRYGAIDDQLLR